MARPHTVKKWMMITSLGLVAACVLVSIGVVAALGSATPPAPPPLQLLPLSPPASTAAPDGTWIVGDSSLVGFRVSESFLVQSGTIVGRTSAVTGSLVIVGNQIASGSFQVDLRQVTLGGKPSASFSQLLETSKYPDATLTFAQPPVFPSLLPTGQTVSAHASVSLTMHGITHPLTFTVQARYNGTVLEAVGSAPSLASDWGITSPFGVQNDGIIEFLVVLHRG
jgi:polyisoprenoid-binding protein YceI